MLVVAATVLSLTLAADPPNIVYFLADDLGYGELGCYGQEKILTPNIDRLAAEGMRFTQHYSGAPVCAPARCVLMTGRHSANAYIRGNKEMGKWGPDEPEGQLPLPADAVTIAEMLGAVGYATGAMGKWGLGGPGSSGHPSNQGFDQFYGYLCQRVAHNYYPTHLWRNHDVDVLGNAFFNAHQRLPGPKAGFDQFIGSTYAPDKILAEAVKFVNENKDGPFFLYLPFVEPHMAMQPPQEWVDRYPADWDDEPYVGGKSYLPHPRPRAGYAAMISDLDEHVGTIVDLIDELGLAENTIIIFTSDNGPTHDVGGVDTSFFNSAGALRGRKGSLYEGGIRVPMIARWTGRIEAGSETDHISAFEDVMPTLARLAGATVPLMADGVSFLPTLLGDPRSQEARPYYVWEFHGYGGQKAVRMGKWKAVQRGILKGETKIKLYDLSVDIAESNDVSASHPEIVARIRGIFKNDRTESAEFPMEQYDEAG